MALTVEIYRLSSWQDITFDIPFFGDPVPGLVPFELEITRESNVAVLRFAVNGGSYSEEALGTEIRVRIDGTQIFGGYLTTRERIRQGTLVGANYECQDYNSVLDRIVITGYTIDAGDTDSTEIETLRASKLAGIGITAGTINTVQASMPELYLQGTFRQAMEQIAAAADGAFFYVDQNKQLNYVAATSDLTTISPETLDDDRSVADSYPYADMTEREDETRKINRVFIIGDGIDGWYPAADSGETYQALVFDESVTTQAALDAVGAAIVDHYGGSLTEYSLRCWEDAFFDGERVSVTHSDFISGGETLYIRRVVMRARSSDAEEREYTLELGDHTIESDNLGGGGPGSGGERGPIFGDGTTHTDIDPDDASVVGVERFAAREDHQHAFPTATPADIGNANAEGSGSNMVRADHVHNHPAGLGANLHHNQSHVLATGTALGPDHTVSGAAAGEVLRALTATTAAFDAIQAGDLPALGGTPALTLSTSNAAGAANTYVRTDDTLHLFHTGNPSTIQSDDSAAPGVGVRAARWDHAHAIVCAAPVALGAAASEGSAASFARSDHVHDAFDNTAPDTITPDQSGAAGSATVAARLDHAHGIVCAAPGTNLSVSTSNAEGSGTSFARADHTHAIDTSSNPGAAASILATDVNGDISVQNIDLAEYIVHAGDADTYLRLRDDRMTIRVGGVSIVDIVEGAADYVAVGGTTIDSEFTAILYAMGGNLGVSQEAAAATLHAYAYGTDASQHMAIWRGRRARGTRASPSAVQSGDALARLGAGGYGASQFPTQSTAYIQMLAAENFTNTAMGTHLQFATTPTGSVTPAEVVRVTASGRVKVGGTSGASGALDVDQDSASGAIPALYLRQAHDTHPFITLVGTSVASDFTRSFVDEDDSPTPTLIGYARFGLDDTRGTGITVTSGYMPIYSLT